MSCPTCDHTMSTLAPEGDHYRYAQCGRCGTTVHDRWTKDETGGAWVRVGVWVPKLVERCRAFRQKFREFHTPVGMLAADLWHRLGITEAINVPAERTPTVEG